MNVLVPRKLVYLLMAMTVLSAPLFACALPGLAMREEEKECCRLMADQCGSSQMEESHSCCTKTPLLAAGALQPTIKFSPLPAVTSSDFTPRSEPSHLAELFAPPPHLHNPSKSPPPQLPLLTI